MVYSLPNTKSTTQQPRTCSPGCRLNSTRRSPFVLVFKTVLESFVLTRLLNWLIVVIDTLLRFDEHLARPMHAVVAVSVEGLQLSISPPILFDVMSFDLVGW
jgi:hypothetical protein